jgi:cold shock CspA family protein
LLSLPEICWFLQRDRFPINRQHRNSGGEKDVFVHVSSLQRGNSLREGDKASFEVGQDRKTGKSKAENVSVL